MGSGEDLLIHCSLIVFQTLYKGLKDMLEYVGSDLEEVYYQTFRICYQDVFGNTIFHDLKEDGDNIFVTQESKTVRI